MNKLEYINVWEVCSYTVDKDGDWDECYDSAYVCTTDYPPNYSTENNNQDEWYEQLIAASGVSPSDMWLVYAARTADIMIGRNSDIQYGEVDCATGYNGSPVYEKQT